MEAPADDQVLIFRDDDGAYLDWIGTHKGGWVVNAHRNPRSDYLQLHKAWCPTISDPRDPGAYTERGYIKLCATSKAPLDSYLDERVGGKPRWNCTQCG
jgi:hypothetical protein